MQPAKCGAPGAGRILRLCSGPDRGVIARGGPRRARGAPVRPETANRERRERGTDGAFVALAIFEIFFNDNLRSIFYIISLYFEISKKYQIISKYYKKS